MRAEQIFGYIRVIPHKNIFARSCIIAVLETITCKTELGGPGVAYLDFPAAVCRFDLDSR